MTVPNDDFESLMRDMLDRLTPSEQSEIQDLAQRMAEDCRLFAETADDEIQRAYFQERAKLWHRIAERQQEPPQ